MLSPRRDPLLQSFHSLSSPHVADALAQLGCGEAPNGLQPLWTGSGRVVGRAATVLLVPAGEAEMCPERGTLEAIRGADDGDLLIVARGGDTSVSAFGGVAAYAAQRHGLVGCVVDGAVRNVDEMAEIHFPVFGRGVVHSHARGHSACAGYGMPVQVGGVLCRPGDIVMADANGVVVVPEEKAPDVIQLAHTILGADNRIKDAIARGVDPLEALDQVQAAGGQASA